MTKVAIAICTYHRPLGLQLALKSIDGQRLSQLRDEDITVVVIDNSKTGAAEPVCESHRALSRFKLIYVHEGRKGLSSARNAAIEAAADEKATHLAFLDDDEVADPEWLEYLFLAITEGKTAAAVGPVYPLFAQPPQPWLPVSCYVVRLPSTEKTVESGYTGNSMVAMDAILSNEARFDPRLNELGGEDTDFFDGLRRGGFRIAWSEEGRVYELVPEHRMSVPFLWRRWYHTAKMEGHIRRGTAPALGARATNLGLGTIRVIGGSVRIIEALFVLGWRGPANLVASTYTLCRGIGLVASAIAAIRPSGGRPS